MTSRGGMMSQFTFDKRMGGGRAPAVVGGSPAGAAASAAPKPVMGAMAPKVGGPPRVGGATPPPAAVAVAASSSSSSAPASTSSPAPASARAPASSSSGHHHHDDPIESSSDLKKRLRSVFDEAATSTRAEWATDIAPELESLWKRFKGGVPAARALVVTAMIDRVMDGKDKDRSDLAELAVFLLSPEAGAGRLTREDVVGSLVDVLEFLPDLKVDSPKADAHIASFVARVATEAGLAATPEALVEFAKQCTGSLAGVDADAAGAFVGLVGSKFAAPVVGAGASNGVNGASESAGSGSGSGSGKDKDDVATRLVQLVEAGEDALEWLSAQKPQPVVASADVGAKVGAAAFGRADGLSAAHVRLLKRITDGDVAAQRAVLSAIAESAKASADSAAASAAFKALYEGDAVGESAFTSWAESPASSKISNDKTKAALSEFVAWLRSAKPREESDEGM